MPLMRTILMFRMKFSAASFLVRPSSAMMTHVTLYFCVFVAVVLVGV